MPYHECKRFDECSATNCPLDPDLSKRVILSVDEKCKSREKKRVEIAIKYPELLPYQGLIRRKHSARRAYQAIGIKQGVC